MAHFANDVKTHDGPRHRLLPVDVNNEFRNQVAVNRAEELKAIEAGFKSLADRSLQRLELPFQKLELIKEGEKLLKMITIAECNNLRSKLNLLKHKEKATPEFKKMIPDMIMILDHGYGKYVNWETEIKNIIQKLKRL